MGEPISTKTCAPHAPRRHHHDFDLRKHKRSKSTDTSAEKGLPPLSNGISGFRHDLPQPSGYSTRRRNQRGFGIDASAKNKFGSKAPANREHLDRHDLSHRDRSAANGGCGSGRREMTVNSEEQQILTIASIVRRVDVNTKNTVQSSAIADAIEIPAWSVVDDVQQPGWFVRFWIGCSGLATKSAQVHRNRSHHDETRKHNGR